MIRTFREFLGNKKLKDKKHLRIISAILKKGGFKVDEFLNSNFENSYIYCYNPNNNTSFKGVRIYIIGEEVSYRVQRDKDTHPYGRAYLIDLDGMFNNFMEDGSVEKEKLGNKMIKEILKCLRTFFKESSKAEKDEGKWNDTESMGMISIRNPLGGDYSSLVHDGTN